MVAAAVIGGIHMDTRSVTALILCFAISLVLSAVVTPIFLASEKFSMCLLFKERFLEKQSTADIWWKPGW